MDQGLETTNYAMTVETAPSEVGWQISETSLSATSAAAKAVVFTLGNGQIEVNDPGPFEPPGSGWTLHGGIYADAPPQFVYFPPPGAASRSPEFPTDRDCMRHTTPALLLLPNCFGLQLTFNGRRAVRALSSNRLLDMRRGMVASDCEVVLPEGELSVRSRRAVVPDQRNIVIERLEITADRAGKLEIKVMADALRIAGHNQYELRRHREGRVAGAQLVVWECEGEGTGDRGAVALAASGPGNGESQADGYGAGVVFRFEVAPGLPITIDRFCAVGASSVYASPSEAACLAVAQAREQGFEALLAETAQFWQAFWEENDIQIAGPPEDQQAVRFALFQLRCAAPPTPARSFGAKFLSGEGYRDCVFWDTDIFIIPYFTRCQPEVARRHGQFRHRTLPAARENACRQGFKGARYPWECLPDGREAQGPWVIFNLTQVHVVCDVAWCIMDYFRWTGDEQFMRYEGAEILAETACFWLSRLTRTERGYELLGVCGPDEAHPRVDNNPYTNLLVRDNLRAAAEWNPEATEREAWLDAAKRLYLPKVDEKTGLLEQFDGFFELKDSLHLERIAGRYYDGYQVCKQADVLMLPMVLPGYLTDEQVVRNYQYYEPRTWHWSSLSEAAHSLVAARAGLTDEAYRMFRNNMLTDLADRQKSTAHGLHAAAIGMVPRNVIEGFAGLQLDAEGKPVAWPKLPEAWRSVSFKVSCAGVRYRFEIKAADVGPVGPVGLVGLNSMIKGIIFDLDGVLVSTDEFHYRGWARLAAEENIPFTRDDNHRQRGVGRMESLELLLENSERHYTDAQKQAMAARKNRYYVDFLQELTPSDALPGVRRVLAELKAAGLRLAVGSSSRNAPLIMEKVGLCEYFEVAVDGTQIVNSKPAPDVFLRAAERLGLPPGECLVVEDAVAGVEAARRAGMCVLAVGPSERFRDVAWRIDDLETLSASHVFSMK